ncbi:hypothetical protein [Dactylosporangium sp. CA-139066]|uniref:hypothetical protein n=1 Tax=Dactylosporangium sp. CA-139066 TaxID=3239930 RepID=UPI003D90CE83
MTQSTGTLITLSLQYLKEGQDITGNPYANLDATAVRAWDDRFLQVAMQRDDADADCWRITGSDAMIPIGAEVETFGSPAEALDFLAHHGRFAYQIVAS